MKGHAALVGGTELPKPHQWQDVRGAPQVTAARGGVHRPPAASKASLRKIAPCMRVLLPARRRTVPLPGPRVGPGQAAGSGRAEGHSVPSRGGPGSRWCPKQRFTPACVLAAFVAQLQPVSTRTLYKWGHTNGPGRGGHRLRLPARCCGTSGRCTLRHVQVLPLPNLTTMVATWPSSSAPPALSRLPSFLLLPVGLQCNDLSTHAVHCSRPSPPGPEQGQRPALHARRRAQPQAVRHAPGQHAGQGQAARDGKVGREKRSGGVDGEEWAAASRARGGGMAVRDSRESVRAMICCKWQC